ncbi:MAG TPA: ribose 5-phosphate isomerase B [Candidatus Deferrimicrobium sp.]|nr:ribose 5-phosphate isomerase B [Candidatus Deferrimicrobium sp.]
MKIALGADHKGFEVKQKVKEILTKLGHEVVDCGTHSAETVDYPDFGLKVAQAVVRGHADFGVTVCWTGNGMNIAVNKVKGVRAGLALNADMAYMTRLHNDANVLTLSAKYTPEGELEAILKAFLDTSFEGGRHIARLDKIRQAEESPPPS